MKRDAIDFSCIKPAHEEIHAQLMNWARWCKGGAHGSNVHPMFRHYRTSYDELPIASNPVDTLGAVALQKRFVRLPETNRWVLQWWYIKPYIPVLRVRQALGMTTPALFDAVHDGRAMLRNTA